MKHFAVIGVGSFGYYIAKTLFEEGHDVIAIDREKEKIQRISEFSSQAILADATNKEILKTLDLDKMNAVVVSTGEMINYSTLITLYLKELNVENIIVKAVDEDHGKVLEKVGATTIVFPERDTAIKLGRNLSIPNILDFLPLLEDFVIVEWAPTKEFIGKSLAESKLRNKYNVHVLAIREVIPDRITLIPPAEFVIKDSDILIVIGKDKDIKKMKEKG